MYFVYLCSEQELSQASTIVKKYGNEQSKSDREKNTTDRKGQFQQGIKQITKLCSNNCVQNYPKSRTKYKTIKSHRQREKERKKKEKKF